MQADNEVQNYDEVDSNFSKLTKTVAVDKPSSLKPQHNLQLKALESVQNMWEYEKIHNYQGKLNLKQIIQEADLEHIDEALHICDLSNIAEKYHIWRKYMPRIKPYYAVKCNDDTIIVKTLAELGTSFDCASKNEIKEVLELGVEPERIIFANPCKPVSHLQYAKEQNVATCTVDNEFEIYKLARHYPASNLVIRFCCEAKEAQCPLGDKFGCDADNDATALMLLAKSLNLNVIGTSFHVGSGCNDFPAYDRAITVAKNLFKFGQLLGYDMKILDIGGGFPGSDNEKFIMIAEIINKSLKRNFSENIVEVIAEPGRFFVASAYTLVCKIHAKREVRSENGKLDTKMYYLNDGVYGSFNCILYDHQHVTAKHLLQCYDPDKIYDFDVLYFSHDQLKNVRILYNFQDDDDDNLPKFKTLIWGPTCDALDKISENLYLPNLNRGDLIAFPNMGAYTVPIACPFNGFMLPRILYFKRQQI